MVDTVLVFDRRRAREFHRLDPKLVLIVDEGARLWPKPRMFIGSIWRSEQENADVGAKTLMHVVEPETGLRSCDASGRNVADWADERWAACKRIAAAVNRIWIYDPRRPRKVVAYAGKHGTGPHVHFQVHPRTRRRRL